MRWGEVEHVVVEVPDEEASFPFFSGGRII